MKGDLANAYTHGRRYTITLNNPAGGLQTASPPNGKCWLVLNGAYTHINLTSTWIIFGPKTTNIVMLSMSAYYREFVLAADVTSVYNLFHNPMEADASATSKKPSGWHPHILKAGDQIYYTSDAGGICTINVLEWDDE